MTDNLAAGMRFYRDALCRGNLAVVDELAADLLLHLPSPAADGGVSQLKHIITSIRSAFADFTMTLEDVIAEGDKLVGRFKLAGTQRAQFMDIAPAGRHFEIEEIMIARLSGGQIAELWTFPDRLSMRQQLGAPPLLPAASRRADLHARRTSWRHRGVSSAARACPSDDAARGSRVSRSCFAANAS